MLAELKTPAGITTRVGLGSFEPASLAHEPIALRGSSALKAGFYETKIQPLLCNIAAIRN